MPALPPLRRTRAYKKCLACDLLMCQWSALCFAQGNLCGCEAAGSRRDDAKDLFKSTSPAISTAHALVPARAAIQSACGACAITHMHMHIRISKTWAGIVA